MAAKKKKAAKAKAPKTKKTGKPAKKVVAKKKAAPVRAAKPTAKKVDKKIAAPVAAKKAAAVKPTAAAKVKAVPVTREPAKKLKAELKPVEAAPVAPAEPVEIVLTDSEGRAFCRVKDCDQAGIVDSYCRFHYLQLWKRIQVRKKILSEGKLERYIEELTARYPDKFLLALLKMSAAKYLQIYAAKGNLHFPSYRQKLLSAVSPFPSC